MSAPATATHRVGRARSDTLVATGLLLVAVATLVVTTAIAFRSWDALWVTLTHLLSPQQTTALYTGLLSSNLMVLQVLCLARLPWLERAWGREVLVGWHRSLGYWSFWLMVVHVLLFVLQRSQRSPDDVAGAMWRLFVSEQWMLVATIGTLLLVAVVVTSIARARARIGYETWHLVHLNAYLGMGLALPHQLVSVDFTSRWTTAFWWALYAGGLAAVAIFRLVLPLARSRRHRIRVVEVITEAPGIVSVVMTGRALERLGTLPGQFFVWRFLGGRAGLRGHPYSLSEAPTPDRLRVTVSGSGDGAVRVASLVPGQRVVVEGPYGGLATLRRRHPHVLMLAAGIGITPLRAMLDEESWLPGEVTVVHRAGSPAEAALRGEVAEICERRGFALVTYDGPRRSAYSWLPEGVEGGPEEVLARLVPDVTDCDIVLCGPPEWTAAVRLAARTAGVARRDLHQEDFAW